MSIEERYKHRYRSGDTPWDTGKPDFNLLEIVADHKIAGCKALEVGCGTGDNAIWLAGNGFETTASDVSGVAIERARQKADETGAECHFIELDFLKNTIEGRPFGFIFDRGCFHSFGTDIKRSRFAQHVALHLEPNGLWLSIIGNADERRQGPGPPQRTATEIVRAVEPFFEILLLVSSHFGSNRPNPPRAWRCLMQKRENETTEHC